MDNINQRIYANLLFQKIDTNCELCCTIVLYSGITLESKVTRTMNVCIMLINCDSLHFRCRRNGTKPSSSGRNSR